MTIEDIKYNEHFSGYALQFKTVHILGYTFRTGYIIEKGIFYRDYDEHPHNGSELDYIVDVKTKVRTNKDVFLTEKEAKKYAAWWVKSDFKKFKSNFKIVEKAYKKSKILKKS